MIEYVSTRNPSIRVRSSRAILDGQAEGGGLYVPSDLDQIKADYHEIISGDFRSMAKTVWNIFFDDYGEELIDNLVERSYKDKFTSEDITPVVKTHSSKAEGFVLELYHGPTSAFKDVALSALPNLMSAARSMNDFTDDILILTATSGDTGSAAIQGFRDVPGTGIIVFYPYGGVSDTQKLQMVTPASANVTACAIRGNFDDAQTGVKRLFREIPEPVKGVSLSSANSINIGRLVPQIVYYFSAYAQLLEAGVIADGDKIDFVVPTGNFGDIMAGWFALRMGLPVRRLVCASNKNDVLTEFLNTGHYDRKRDFYKTTSPSMAILVSSNLERLVFQAAGEDCDVTGAFMKQLSEEGFYEITDKMKEELTDFYSDYSSEAQTSEEIRTLYEKAGYVIDTHTAVASNVYRRYRDNTQDQTKCVIASTASPYKFLRSVMCAIRPECADMSDFELIDELHALSGVAVPQAIEDIRTAPQLHNTVVEVDEMSEESARWLGI